jgi:ATP-binding cassette, subfamily B, bacterial CvaB/MchF/RaxB
MTIIIAVPMRYGTLTGDMGTVLSGGQKQRVLVARVLYRGPSILMLEEATSHLDVERERAVNDALRATRMTRIVIAHRPETIRASERVVALVNGEIAFDGTTPGSARHAVKSDRQADPRLWAPFVVLGEPAQSA